MKRILSILMTMSLLFSLCPSALASENDGFRYFQPVNDYSADSFADVSGWCTPYVNTVYTLGLMRGSENSDGERIFNANGPISLAETITLASRIHSTYFNNNAEFQQSDIWYQPYVDYAVQHNIIPSQNTYQNYSKAVTRAEFAVILARALPTAAYSEINTIEFGAIPDVIMSESYAFSVYQLYRAGISTGSGVFRQFNPDSNITRCEVAAVAVRIVQPELRQSFSLYAPIYVGFTKDISNQGAVGITELTMTTDGTMCYLTMHFKSQKSQFLSISNALENLYILKVVEIDPRAEEVTFTFPMKTLEQIYTSSKNPTQEKLIMEFYANGNPSSVVDRFYISINQFSKYF